MPSCTIPMRPLPWILAARPKTLPAAAVPVAVGTALAYADGALQWTPAILALAFALLIQIGTNFANDVLDAEKGADTPSRTGPTRAVASGQIRAGAMHLATALTFALALAVGCALIPYGGWGLLPLGLVCIALGYLYTGGPYPLAYHGLGDVFVLVFFGPVAVGFTYYVQAGSFPLSALYAGLGCGALATCLLVVNNLRDREEDAAAGKRTLAVRFGRTFAVWEFYLLGLGAMVMPALMVVETRSPGPLAAALLTTVFARLRVSVARAHDGPTFNRALAGTALLLLAYGFLLCLGVILATQFGY